MIIGSINRSAYVVQNWCFKKVAGIWDKFAWSIRISCNNRSCASFKDEAGNLVQRDLKIALWVRWNVRIWGYIGLRFSWAIRGVDRWLIVNTDKWMWPQVGNVYVPGGHIPKL